MYWDDPGKYPWLMGILAYLDKGGLLSPGKYIPKQ